MTVLISASAAATLHAEMLQDPQCAARVFAKVADGRAESIHLGIALMPHTDGGFSLMLSDSLGWSMLKAPSRMLPFVGVELRPNEACFPLLALEESDAPPKTEQLLLMARRMFQSFNGTSLEPKATQCLKALDVLEAEYAPPNNAFEPSEFPRLWRAAGALREFAPAARTDRRRAAAQRGR